MPAAFELLQKYSVQSIMVHDQIAFEKLAGHLGAGLRTISPIGWLEFEISKRRLEDWVYGIALNVDNLPWYNREFFWGILELPVDYYRFQCHPAIVVDTPALPGEMWF